VQEKAEQSVSYRVVLSALRSCQDDECTIAVMVADGMKKMLDEA
jgi:hypothetical protein